VRVSQPDLFSDYGSQLRDLGMERAASRDPAWCERAYAAIVEIARRQPELHVDDVLRFFTPPPPHHNSWGGVWMRLVRNKVIEKTGRTRRTRDTIKHAHEYPIYRSRIFGR
jgi:hypothetical protein